MMENREEIYYFDKDGNSCEAEKAVKVIIRELDENGELVNETTLFKS